MAPYSDIDLLFLHPYKLAFWCEQVIEYILYSLWDLGFKLGHSVRTVKDCIKFSKFDIITKTSILESRYICGDRKLYNQLKSLNFKLPIIKSPRSYVSNKSKIGEGTIIMHDVIVNANSIIGKNCIINNKSLVEHDVEVGDNCHISTGSIINGNCIVGDNTFIGSGSTIVNGQKIPPQSFIKAGTRYYNKENKE